MTALVPDLPQVELAVVEMTNRARAEQKLAAVATNPQLAAAARAYAAYLAKNGAFSHSADGREAGDRITAAGYQWCQVGENLALAQSSAGFAAKELATRAIEGWLNSPGHRENLMQPHVTEIGVGVAKAPDKDPKFITVQLFGRPKSLSYEFQISNSTKEKVAYTFGGETHEVAPSFAVTHTACMPSALDFRTRGTGSAAKPLAARFEAADGLVYTLKTDTVLGVKVEVTTKQKVR
jgi:hypothetical protein